MPEITDEQAAALEAINPGDKVLGEYQQSVPDGAEAVNAKDDLYAGAGANRTPPPLDFTMEPQQAQQYPPQQTAPQVPPPHMQIPQQQVPPPHTVPVQPVPPPHTVPSQPVGQPMSLPFQQAAQMGQQPMGQQQAPGTMGYQHQTQHFNEQPVNALDPVSKNRYACDILGQLFIMLRQRGVVPGAYMMVRVNDFLASCGYGRLQ